MLRFRSLPLGSSIILLPLACLCFAAPAGAYVDLAPTLSKVVSDSKQIAVVEVVEFNRDKRVVVLKEVRALKGDHSAGPIRHEVSSSEGATIPRPVLQWAEPGAQAVLFVGRSTALVCLGQGWYQVRTADAGDWKLSADRPDLPLAYYGTVSRLADGIEHMLAGGDAVLTVVSYGADDPTTSVDLALNRTNMPGLARVARIRANLKMPPMVMAASANPAYLIGQGPVDETDLPALIEKLRSPDATARAEAVEDLGWLDGKAGAAAASVEALVTDPSPRVRLSAAAALLRIKPQDERPVEVLAQGLDNPDPGVRRHAARVTGLAGRPAGSLTPKLAGLLKDKDEPTRVAALQAIALLGRAAAASVDAVTPLLDDHELAIDAADALGRIGPAARPALKQLTRMLSAEQPAIRWAAVRAIAQIGGEEAHPAVDFILKIWPGKSEAEGYNMMIYLALLGPVAKDALPALRNPSTKNPVLPSATSWAIQSDKTFPWSAEGGFGMRGPGGDGPDFGRYIYEAYIQELGDRLRPAARLLAQKILEGTAGDIPAWGYRILACGPDEALGILSPRLSDTDITMRERAAVALGHMGPTAAPARNEVAAALSNAATEAEKRLLRWCLRQIDGQ